MFNDEVMMACDEVCWKRGDRRSNWKSIVVDGRGE